MAVADASAGRESRHLAIALLIVAAGALLRGAFAILVPLFEVESYYWLWSRELAWGYYDHPRCWRW